MGNQQSKHANRSPSLSPSSPRHTHGSPLFRSHAPREQQHHHHPAQHGRRASVQVSASPSPSPSHPVSGPHSPPAARPVPGPARYRSATDAASPTSPTLPTSPLSPTATARMGNSQSHEADADRPDSGRKRDRHHHHGKHESAPQQQQPPQRSQSARKPNETHASHPVQVPEGGRARRGAELDPSAAPPAPGADYAALSSNLNFPPRLPLPIQEEDYTPGSPIITAADLAEPRGGGRATAAAAATAGGGAPAAGLDEAVLLGRGDEEEAEGGLQHQASVLSNSTTIESDEDDALVPEEHKGRTVPVTIEWRQPGSRVYITGTFNQWSKKSRMHRDQKKSVLSATLNLQPGTHHVKFIVDGNMQLSPDLPQAVDYTNVLVNYLEVSADDLRRDGPAAAAPPDAARATKQTPTYGLHPPLVLPPGIETTDFAAPAPTGQQGPPAQPQEPAPEAPTTISTRAVHYGTRVPAYLLDLDRDEGTPRFRRAARAVAEIPTPPTLPLFLSKSILNGAMPVRDDASVLNMPNHTVLNHLATSSIKNDVLATSLTTRYKRKYVTSIIYRPVMDS